MTDQRAAPSATGTVRVRYWASARSAAGVDSDILDVVGETTLDKVLMSVRALHRDRPRLGDVVAICSVLIGDRPVGSSWPDEVVVRPGDTVELLPPFAGG